MTGTVAAADRPTLRLSPQTALLLAVASLAWAAVVAYARHMGNGRGTMGLALGAFVTMWAGMMSAMMLTAVSPVASLYARTITQHRARRLALFVGGYLVAWAATALPAYYLLRLVDHFAGGSDAAMRNIAVGVLVLTGVYQLTPLKSRCLRHCRSPLAQLLHYGNVRGRARELKVSLHHAGYCLGCCWALMALFGVFGVMNVWAMVGLAAVVLAEKAVPYGESIGRAVGVAALVLALGVLVSHGIADAVVPAGSMPGRAMTHMSG
ncbi:MAG TPA: DUF2182 domain-containing protein [Acidimicrobiales bacterium]|nr:DUF2182 domain-containing protein [Acidimicrobiales bacterium]